MSTFNKEQSAIYFTEQLQTNLNDYYLQIWVIIGTRFETLDQY